MEFPKVRIHECKPLKPNPKFFNRKTQGCMQREAQTCWLPRDGNYRDRLKSMQILLSRSQAGPGRTGKQEQGQTSRNHVQAFQPISVYQHQFWNIFYWKQSLLIVDPCSNRNWHSWCPEINWNILLGCNHSPHISYFFHATLNIVRGKHWCCLTFVGQRKCG